jgi:hypothetical protein
MTIFNCGNSVSRWLEIPGDPEGPCVAAVIERELDELGEYRLFDHQQRAGWAAQPVFVRGHARMRFDVSLVGIPWTRKNSTAATGVLTLAE